MIKNLWIEIKKRVNNFIICVKYPFFWPRNVWTGKKCSGFFSFTELDHLPNGWRKAFGIQMAEEIQKCVNKLPKSEKKHFIITQLKEKYGSLRLYTSYTFWELDKIISKYEKISEETCVSCGKPAKWFSEGYILPYCDDCKNKDESQKYRKNNKRNKAYKRSFAFPSMV